MTTSDPGRLLRNTFRVNAISSAGCGLAFLAAAGPLAPLLGPSPLSLRILGGLLLLFAAHVWRVAAKDAMPRGEALYLIGNDVVWVIGSAAALLAWPQAFTTAGRVFFALIADWVAALAIIQFVGWRRLHCVTPSRA
jgi:hypothetical protein